MSGVVYGFVMDSEMEISACYQASCDKTSLWMFLCPTLLATPPVLSQPMFLFQCRPCQPQEACPLSFYGVQHTMIIELNPVCEVADQGQELVTVPRLPTSFSLPLSSSWSASKPVSRAHTVRELASGSEPLGCRIGWSQNGVVRLRFTSRKNAFQVRQWDFIWRYGGDARNLGKEELR
jgi:hypothetical protein